MKGFLPKEPPLREYQKSSPSLDRLQEIAHNLPKLLLTSQVQPTVESLTKDDLSIQEILESNSEREIRLAMVHLSFISHAYVLGGGKPNDKLPEVLAAPWVRVSKFLGRPPVLSYASYCLDNWFLLEQGEICLENVGLINNFLGGVDEDWFVTIHVCIEHAASGAIEAADKLSRCDNTSNETEVKSLLSDIEISLKKVNKIFLRMTERCDPYIYYHRVRPFIFGSKDNPDLKNGLIYENQFSNEAQFFRGETGAQSSIVPTLDGVLEVKHSKDALRHYLNEMREYMPPEHRNFIERVENSTSVRDLVLDSSNLKKIYYQCLEELSKFRALHLNYADMYIHKQSQQKNPFGTGGSTIKGTGGTPFMTYLKKHLQETKRK